MKASSVGGSCFVFVFVCPMMTSAEEDVPSLNTPIRVAEDLAVIEQIKWPSAERNFDFELSLVLPSGERVAARVESDGVQWRITLPYLPKPDGSIQLRYTYVFEPDEAEVRKAVAAFVGELVARVARAYSEEVRAAGKAGRQPALNTAAFRAPLTKAVNDMLEDDSLSNLFVVKKPASEALLEYLDFEQNGGVWSLQATSRLRRTRALIERADREPAFQALRRLDGARTTDVAPKCVEATRRARAGVDEVTPPDMRELEAVFATCRTSLEGSEGRNFDIDSSSLNPDDNYSNTTAGSNLANTATSASQRPANVAIGQRYDHAALVWAAREKHAANAKDALIEALGLDGFVQRVTGQVERGAAKLTSVKPRRRWEFTTGVVYVVDLDDVVAPLLLSVCPAGCLRADEDIFSAPFWSVWSLDFGVAAATLDTPNPRSGGLALMVGASFNPVSILRIAGGVKVYENQRSLEIAAAPYFGVTADVLTAAEVLAPLGLGLPRLQTEPSEAPSSKE